MPKKMPRNPFGMISFSVTRREEKARAIKGRNRRILEEGDCFTDLFLLIRVKEFADQKTD